MPNARIVVAAAVGVAAVAGLVIVLAASSDRDDDAADAPLRTQRATLTLERAQHPAGYEELIVSLPDDRLNTPQTTGGETSVLLTCADDRGRVTIRRPQPWPLPLEPGFPPHAHQPAKQEVLDSLRRCSLTAKGMDFDAWNSE